MTGQHQAVPWDLDTYRKQYEELVELCRRERERNARLQRFANLVMDLDRCPHGRHEQDVCGGTSGCNGPSRGNPLLHSGDVLGYTMSRQPIVMPERGQRHDPEAWIG